jgi:hypothetical protein
MGFSSSYPLEQTTAAFGSMNFDPSNQQASPIHTYANATSLYSQNPSEGNFPTDYSQNTPYYSSPATRFTSQQSRDQQPHSNIYLDSNYEKEPTSQQDPLYLPAPFECKCDLDPELCKVVLWPRPSHSKSKDSKGSKQNEVKSTSSRANTKV